MINGNDLINLRRSYSLKELSENSIPKEPIQLFSDWIDEAIKSNLTDPHAMVLATSNKEGISSARIVLLRSFDELGLIFYTNYQSAKASDITENPNAALLFFWAELERQIRINGTIEKISTEESEKYFSLRPRDHQIAAWASEQSRIIESRKILEAQFSEVQKRFSDKEIPLPPFWGGYRLIPGSFEFWQGRKSRLHDRFLYKLEKNEWKLMRLAP